MWGGVDKGVHGVRRRCQGWKREGEDTAASMFTRESRSRSFHGKRETGNENVFVYNRVDI